jgi:hypothetical protein
LFMVFVEALIVGNQGGAKIGRKSGLKVEG